MIKRFRWGLRPTPLAVAAEGVLIPTIPSAAAARQRWLLARPNVIYLSTFFLLNLLLFLPSYLLNWDEGLTFTPQAFWSQPAVVTLRQLWLWRDTVDPFRLNLELTLGAALWISIQPLRRRWLRPLFMASYFLTLFYYLYDAITRSIYQSEPNVYHHYTMAADGLQFLLAHLHLSWELYVAAVIGALLALLGVHSGLRLLYSITLTAQVGRAVRSGMVLLAAIALITTVLYGAALAAPPAVISSLTTKVATNVAAASALYQQVTTFDDSALQAAYDYHDKLLVEKPNLYLIFVESYGSVLYKRDDYRPAYRRRLAQLEQQLAAAGWHTASALSESPTWGGGSWMAYTSAYFGLRIDSHPQYLALLDQYQLTPYPDLGHYLQGQGYRNVRISSIAAELPQEDWVKYTKVYGVDRWLRHEDFNFVGAEYGWGPAPPDQYVLHYAQEILHQESADPFVLFFITQNSHYPFAPRPTRVADWRTLNQVSGDPGKINDEARAHPERRQDYFEAIDYELSTLVDFIGTNQDEKALFVLIGDHQPPRVSKRTDGFDTPVHFISRNQALITGLADYGFDAGLIVRDSRKPTLKHEGFYSLVVRTLLTHYGPADGTLPPYLPDGFVEKGE